MRLLYESQGNRMAIDLAGAGKILALLKVTSMTPPSTVIRPPR
jgi:hypothetical protein